MLYVDIIAPIQLRKVTKNRSNQFCFNKVECACVDSYYLCYQRFPVPTKHVKVQGVHNTVSFECEDAAFPGRYINPNPSKFD